MRTLRREADDRRSSVPRVSLPAKILAFLFGFRRGLLMTVGHQFPEYLNQQYACTFYNRKWLVDYTYAALKAKWVVSRQSHGTGRYRLPNV